MTTKKWPQPPKITTLEDRGTYNGCFGGGCTRVDDFTVKKPTTACKHGEGDCEECGTTNRRDQMHETRGGRGVVGQAVARSRKKR